MQLHSIDLDGFGLLNDLTLAQIGSGVNVIYGSNGSGKSTLLQFLRGIFCGFSEGRKIGLLPPAGGGVGGGSLRVRWEGDVCRFSRIDQPGLTDELRVKLVRSDLETTHPRFNAGQLRADLVPLLYTVGAADVHAIDTLLQQARRDGIQLVSRRENPERLNRAARHVHNERSSLLQNNGTGRVADLAQERQRLQTELQGLTDQLRHLCRQWEAACPQPPPEVALQCRRRVTWLRRELAAVECDLREAQDRSWKPQPAARTVAAAPVPTTPSLAHLKPQRREHIDVQRIHRLRLLDRRIDHARTLLAETAQARLEINLRSAQIAGSDDTPAEPFLKQVRESLTLLEVGLLELRDDARQLTDTHQQQCVCGRWQQTTQEAVGELSRHLYQLCERVSRYELRHNKSVLAGAEATIAACELELLQHLETLRTQRRAILDASGNHRAWKGSVQSRVEHMHCECLEHEPRLGWSLPELPISTPVKPQPDVRTFRTTIKRPTREDLSRLQRRVDRLREELAAATQQWREARNRRPPIEYPADVQALEQRIDQTRLELSAVEANLTSCQERWRVLSVTGEVIRRLVEKMERDQRPTVIQWAAQYLQRLTGGRHVDIVVDEGDHTLQVIADDGSSLPRSALSRGTLDQLALSLRLALVRAYAARGVRFPLVLDDVLVDTDQQRLQNAVGLLQEFAGEQDQQIVYLTCQTHLANLFEQQGNPVRTLPGSSRRTPLAGEGRPQSDGAIRGWVDRKSGDEVRPMEPISVERPSLPQVEATTKLVEPQLGKSAPSVTGPSQPARHVRLLKPLQRRQPDGPYWLSMDAPVELIPSIGTQMGRRLSGLGLLSAMDLIDLDTGELSLRLASLQITPERLRDWQAEAVLLCCVPDLTGPDAQLLVTLGVRDAQQLSETNLDRLLRTIDDLSEAQRVRIGFTTGPGRDVVQRWIHSSRRARSLRDARRFSRSRRRSSSRPKTSSSRRSSQARRQSASSPGGSSRRSHKRRPSRHSPRRSSSDRSRSQTSRQVDRQEPEAIIRPFVPEKLQAGSDRSETQWRFYLSPESPVVDAPSIGPTTSNRLAKIGVITVADLLHRPAEDIASRLKNRRIKAETVLLWQQQARLMCRIPLLRGHDAQVLIACGILEPEQVASMSAEALFAIIGPYVATVEGQRLLRSSKTPDLDEVTDWIHWARHSRTLRAA